MSDRINRLTARFQPPETQEVEPPAAKTAPVALKPYTLYFASDTRKKIDRAFKDVQHRLYPTDFARNEFYTALLEVGIKHIDEVADAIREATPPEPEIGP